MQSCCLYSSYTFGRHQLWGLRLATADNWLRTRQRVQRLTSLCRTQSVIIQAAGSYSLMQLELSPTWPPHALAYWQTGNGASSRHASDLLTCRRWHWQVNRGIGGWGAGFCGGLLLIRRIMIWRRRGGGWAGRRDAGDLGRWWWGMSGWWEGKNVEREKWYERFVTDIKNMLGGYRYFVMKICCHVIFLKGPLMLGLYMLLEIF